MVVQKGHSPVHINNILSEMENTGGLNQSLMQGVRAWREGIEKGQFKANARTHKEGFKRTMTLMRGVANKNQEELEEGAWTWVKQGKRMFPDNSEAGLRLRLAEEVALSLRRGGIKLSAGEITQDVAGFVEGQILARKPELRQELQSEGHLSRPDHPPEGPIIEGEFTVVPPEEKG